MSRWRADARRRRARGDRPVAARAGERPLTDWERGIVAVLADVGGPGSDVVRESVPHLLRTGGCGCGCPSFNVRDSRFPRQPHVLGIFANGGVPDQSVGFVLYVGGDGRPLGVDVESDGEDVRPSPATVIAERP